MTDSSFSGLLNRVYDNEKPIDLLLFFLFASCLAFGLVMVASASITMAEATYNNPLYFVVRQGIFIGMGLVGFAVCLSVPTREWLRLDMVVLGVSVLLLIAVLIFGREVNGSTRWLPMGAFNLQPSEVAKVGVVIYIASFLSRKVEEVRGPQWRGFIKPMVVLIVAALLLLMEPDFGSTVVIAGAVMGMIFLAGVRKRVFVALSAMALGSGALLIAMAPYRLKRLIAFRDPWSDQFGSGYQLTQSLIGFGRGGLTGEGLGDSIQKLFFLPEAHTDFIFSVIAEELGLLGALIVITLLFSVAWRAMQIGLLAERAGQLFSAYLAYGLGILFGAQVAINVGVSSGLLPTKGLALPLFSYGGSSLIMNCVAIGLLMRIDYERRIVAATRTVTRKNISRT